MSLISLKNVSKYYYNKGVIASGITKVNLDFEMGEFVAITGESGSGKSTLLNIISGLDTYEDGELYICNKETSHYQEADFEAYRRKYIANIFQNFNLINSYTVYQNIELILTLNGAKKKEIKPKVLKLLKQVNLEKFRHTKVSKLSGGQKQRVAIARALAKDSPIIIADEPTGNLDSKSAKSIISLLSKISKNKLVIIVTHNYDQVEKYVTRKIKMHDGKILEDKIIKPHQKNENNQEINCKNITPLNKLRIGIRNAFNIPIKFFLILAVYIFMIVALMAEYSSFKEQEYLANKLGYNGLLRDTSDKRIIIKKNDKSPITSDDYQILNNLKNVDYIVKNDLLIDTSIFLTDKNSNFWLDSPADSIDNFHGKLDHGRMPQNDNEIIITGSKDDYYLSEIYRELLATDLYLTNPDTNELDKNISLKIVGIKYTTANYNNNYHFYLSNNILNTIKIQNNQKYSNITTTFLNSNHQSDNSSINFLPSPNPKVPSGEVYISSDENANCKNENCINYPLTITVNNIYYEDKIELKVTKTYTRKNIKSILDLEDFDNNNGYIYINPNDFNKLFNKDNYQSSIYVKDISHIDDTIKDLNNAGYHTLKVKDTLVKTGFSEYMHIIKTIVTLILIITLFFISYFVIRIILKSRNIYFATIRMLGASQKISLQLLIIELLTLANVAYISFMAILYLKTKNIIKFAFLKTIINYLKLSDYLLIYLTLIIISLLISLKFSQKLFKNSAIKTIGEEV